MQRLSQIKPSRIRHVNFFDPVIEYRDKNKGSPGHPKGAAVTLDWWDPWNKEYVPRIIKVSRERGEQFAQTR